MKCLLAKPALTPAFNNTGVISRYDDLVYTHIQQTFSIHYTGHFLAWHRYYTATYERMLRDECGYEGGQPYWDCPSNLSFLHPLSAVPGALGSKVAPELLP